MIIKKIAIVALVAFTLAACGDTYVVRDIQKGESGSEIDVKCVDLKYSVSQLPGPKRIDIGTYCKVDNVVPTTVK